jgi:imidazolonepropionase-like amidohydrolase
MSQAIFENATLFDGEQREMPTGMSVLVEDQLIREVSDRPIESAEAERIDCAGRTLMPGLIDCHVHVYAASLRLGAGGEPASYYAQYGGKFLRHILACGFTTVRDIAGGDHGLAMALRQGFLEGPRYIYGGRALTQTGGHGDLRPSSQDTDWCSCGAEVNFLAIVADGVDDCVKAVREELRKGASHIKIMGSGGVMSPSDPLDKCQYSEAEIEAIVDECRRHGAYVAAHCHPDEAVRRCTELGVRSIEHATLITPETARLVAETGAFVVPTFAVMAALLEDGKQMGVPQRNLDKLMMIHGDALKGLEIMRDAGVKMAFGTDLLAEQHTRQGTEFTLRAEVLEPFEILRSATSVSAELLCMQDQIGCIKPGAFADLIVVDGDPMHDLKLLASNGRDLRVIMRNGHFVKRELGR